jgi:hypothetical protein
MRRFGEHAALGEEPVPCEPGYLPVSRLAVAAAAVGGISALALASPVFWVLPLVAIGIAVAALNDVGRPGTPKAGRLIALTGLALAAGFGTQAVSAKITTRSIMAARAAAAARLWLDTIREERLTDARSMCGFKAVDAVNAVAACGASVPAKLLDTSAGESEGTWLVRATVGGCTIEITLEPIPVAWQGRQGERWLVQEAAVFRPSGN